MFPGDSVFSQRWTWTLSSECPVNVSEITLSPHTGSHTDAPLHYDAGGQSIAEVSLETYLGPCRVILRSAWVPSSSRGTLIATCKDAERVLFRTYRAAPVTMWDANFTAVAPDDHLCIVTVCV